MFLRKLEIDLPEDPAIPLFEIFPKDAPQCHRGMCSTMFRPVLFVIVRSSSGVPGKKNGYRKCGSFTLWDNTQLSRRKTS